MMQRVLFSSLFTVFLCFQYAYCQSLGAILINAGGPTLVDSMGNVWKSDAYFVHGGGESFTQTSPIAGTSDEELYQSLQVASNSSQTPLKYEVPVPNNGLYDVHLHFCEISPDKMAVGARVFHVMLEGNVTMENLDVYSEIGHHTALIKSATVHVNDGLLSIEFQHEGAMISAIEILPVSTTATTSPRRLQQQVSLPLFINAGGSNYVDSKGRSWIKDKYFNNGGLVEAASVSANIDIKNTVDDVLYQTARFDPPSDPKLEYNIPIANGEYEVVMHFSENWDGAQKINGRVFNVLIEGTIAFLNVDIFKEAGSYTPLIKRKTVTVSDGSLTIGFGNRIRNNGKVSAIEVHQVSSSSSPPQTASPNKDATYRINAGGASYTDSNGNTYIADSFYNNGGQRERWTGGSRGIAKTNDDALYREARFDPPSDPQLKYDLPVLNGQYQVVMHFSETYSAINAPGGRVFDVFIEGKKVLSRFDIFAEAGGSYTAVTKTVNTQVNDGKITIEFGKIVENAKICAIEVFPMGSPTPSLPSSNGGSSSLATVPLRINVGGNTFTSPSGVVWQQDKWFSNGLIEKLHGGTQNIFGTTNDLLYQTARYDPSASGPPLEYNIPIANGDYTVTLHWADVYGPTQRIGGREFDVIIQGSTVLKALDIFRQVGANAALEKSFQVQVTNQKLEISFRHVQENPKLCAIEIVAGSSSPGSSQSSIFPLYINAGGPALTDSTGISWVEDSYYNNGGEEEKSFGSAVINGAADSAIYLTGRYDPKSRPALQYKIPCPSGEYSVVFHFAELYPAAFSNDSRVFSIKIENVLVLNDIDIYKESGGARTALTKTVSTKVFDGMMDIEFVHGIENPKVSAIEIHHGKSTDVSPPATGPASGNPIYINVGSTSSFIDSKGNTWIADTYFTSGKIERASGSIADTSDDALFRAGRYDGYPNKPMKYEVPVSSNGSYDVSLLVAETYGPAMKTGARVYDVSINGSKILSSFDIYKEAKAGNKALVKTTNVYVTNKKVVIEFESIKENAKVNAISIVPSSSSSSGPPVVVKPPTLPATPFPTLPIRINAGATKSYTDTSGNVWAADKYYSSAGENESLWNPVSTIYGTPDDTLYMTAKYDASPSNPALVYDIPVPNGDLEVTLHFCELYAKTMYKGARVFDVLVEGQTRIDKLDIYDEAGGFTALKKKMDVKVDDNKLTIALRHVIENPKISAIEIHKKGAITTVSSGLAPPPIQSSYLINVGGGNYKDSSGRTWQADKYYNNGGEVETIPNSLQSITKTLDDELYHTGRYDPDSGPSLKYEFPVPDGDYAVTMHFAELWKGAFKTNARVFNVLLEGAVVIQSLDIYKEVGNFAALAKTEYASVNDGFLTLEFAHEIENPKLSAVEIKPATIPQGRNSHRAHAVPGGKYVKTDADGNGFETIKVDGSFSHTHTAGSTVDSFTWKVEGAVVGTGEVTEITLPVGFHTLTLDVVDSDGDKSSDYTVVTVKPQGFPDIKSLSPSGGDVTGGNTVLINGSGFASSAASTKVKFGSTTLTGSQITVISESLIEVKSAPTGFIGPAEVTVETEVGPSNKAYYTYSDKTLPPVDFKFGVAIKDIFGPTSVAFGPDGKLYIGTQGGKIYKASLDANYKVIESTLVVSTVVADSSLAFRSILGIAFDPMDVSPNPTVYVAHCQLFHGNVVDYNGKVSAVSGAKLDNMKHVVTGLPVSDHDHGINGMEFDDNGDLYIQVGGNTNAGVPGALSSTLEQDEHYLSAATVVAHLSRPNFDGNVKYDKNEFIIGDDVEVWASGQRNSFDIVLHSNGYMYGTDNGPNNKYGATSVDCDEQTIDPHEDDELNLLEKGKYYGHANRKRGETDPRQCKWRSATENSDTDYTAPMIMLPASCNGIAEFQTRHFGGQLRGDLLIGRYKGALYHVTLSNDGRSVAGKHKVLESAGGLDVTQGPDGTLFVAQNTKGKVITHSPVEPALGQLLVVSVFPRRGPKAGGSNLTLYGEQFGSNPIVTVGGKNCPVQSNNGKKMTCKLPSGNGKADVVVTSGGKSDTFTDAYRYISGGKP